MTAIVELVGGPWAALAVYGVIIVAAVVQSGLGMGFGMTAAPLLALINPELVPGPALWIATATAGLGAWRERANVDWAEVGVGTLGRIAGTALAVIVLSRVMDQKTFMLVFGLMIALAVGLSVSGWTLPFTRINLLLMTAVSGIIGTITSVGAPPLALVYHSRPPLIARPTLSAFFCLGCAISLLGLVLSGLSGIEDAKRAAVMAPAMVLGIAIAGPFRTRLTAQFRPALLGVAAIAAVILIIRGLV